MQILSYLAAFVLGLSRGGLKGISPIFVLLMAAAYGGKTSSGIIVPLLLLGDIFALYYYRKYIKKKEVLAFLPWVLLGALIAGWIGKDLSEVAFKKGLAILILSSMLFMWLWDFYLKKEMKAGPFISGITGLGAGFFAILGNFAGAFANIYFLLTRLPRMELVGTATMVFFIVNVFKIPLHIYVWETITIETLQIDLYLLPIAALGFVVGVKVIDVVSDNWFRQFLYAATFLGALLILR